MSKVTFGLYDKLRQSNFSSGLQSPRFLGWNRIPNNYRSMSRTFLSDSGSPIEPFFTSHS